MTTATARLRARIAIVAGQLAEIERRLALLDDARGALRAAEIPVCAKVSMLLERYPSERFTVPETMECAGASENNARKVLTRLVQDGEIRRVAHGSYQTAGEP